MEFSHELRRGLQISLRGQLYGHKKLARIGVGSKFRASLRMLENIRKT